MGASVRRARKPFKQPLEVEGCVRGYLVSFKGLQNQPKQGKTTGRACPVVTKSLSGATCSKVTAPELWLSAQEAVDLYAASKRISKPPKPLPHLATG